MLNVCIWGDPNGVVVYLPKSRQPFIPDLIFYSILEAHINFK